MGQTITYGNYTFADCSVGHISGSEAIGFAQLHIDLIINIQSWNDDERGHIPPQVEILPSKVSIQNKSLGYANPCNPGYRQRAYTYSNEWHVYLELPLSWSQLRAIEDIRHGEEFCISIKPEGRFWDAA